MTESEFPGPESTGPQRVIQAIPLQAVPSQPEASESDPIEPDPIEPETFEALTFEPAPFQPASSQAVPPQAVPSQAALFRERPRPADADADDGEEMPLLPGVDELRAGWQKIKAGFVDNPRGSVAEAANVVEKATDRLLAALRAQQDRVRDSWDGDPADADTESLRQALLTYQSLFSHIAGH